MHGSEEKEIISSNTFGPRIPFVSHAAAQEEFAHSFTEAHASMTPDVLKQISVIEEDWPSIWIPQHSQHRYALYKQRLAKVADEKAKRKTYNGFYSALQKVPHEVGTPHTFLLLLRQLNADAFPLWHMRNRDWWSTPANLGQ